MAILLLAAFIGVPLLEIAVFIEVGDRLGLWNTLGFIILTAIIGIWLLRIQGLATLSRARSQIDQGVLPTSELFDGVCLLIAGVLLLTPGFVTDSIGFALLAPPLRNLLRRWLGRRMELRMTTSTGRGPPDGDFRDNVRGPFNGSDVIDGEFQDLTDKADDDDSGRDRSGNGGPKRPNERKIR
jgi:UPF0716 protein FxsA